MKDNYITSRNSVRGCVFCGYILEGLNFEELYIIENLFVGWEED